MYMGTPLELVC